MGNNREIVVLRRAQAVDEDEGEAGWCGRAGGVGVGVVEGVVASFEEGHFRIDGEKTELDVK